MDIDSRFAHAVQRKIEIQNDVVIGDEIDTQSIPSQECVNQEIILFHIRNRIIDIPCINKQVQIQAIRNNSEFW